MSSSNHKSNQEESVVGTTVVVVGGVVVVVVVGVVAVLTFILSIRSLRMRISRRRRRRSLWGAMAAPVTTTSPGTSTFPVLLTLMRLFVFLGLLVTSLGLFPLWAMICRIRAQLDLVRVKLQGVALASYPTMQRRV